MKKHHTKKHTAKLVRKALKLQRLEHDYYLQELLGGFLSAGQGLAEVIACDTQDTEFGHLTAALDTSLTDSIRAADQIMKQIEASICSEVAE